MKPRDGERAYLAACTMYRDDADYLAEWIEFHRLMGVERFVLYDNGSTDHHLDVLAPYLDEGIARRHEWPAPFLGQKGRPRALITAFEHCVGAHRDDARWVAFLDIDEFLFSPAGVPLPEALRDYEAFPGVVVTRAEFGPSGHMTKPAGLVIESYLERRRLRPDDRAQLQEHRRAGTGHTLHERTHLRVPRRGSGGRGPAPGGPPGAPEHEAARLGLACASTTTSRAPRRNVCARRSGGATPVPRGRSRPRP